MPMKINQFVKRPILNTDSLNDLQAKTFPAWVTIIAVRQAVVACI